MLKEYCGTFDLLVFSNSLLTYNYGDARKGIFFTLSFTGHKFITFNTILYSISAASQGLRVFTLPRAMNRTQCIVDNREAN